MNPLHISKYLCDRLDVARKILDNTPIVFSVPIAVLHNHFIEELIGYMAIVECAEKVMLATDTDINKENMIKPGVSVETLVNDKRLRKVAESITTWYLIVGMEDASELEETFIDYALMMGTGDFQGRVEISFSIMQWPFRIPGCRHFQGVK